MALSEGLKGAVECNGGSGWVSHSGGTVGKFVLLCGDRSASVHVHIGREKATNGAGFHYPMRLEFNPRKLKLAGAKDLLGTFAMASDKPFDFGSFLAAARVTRLDVAVDFVGLRPSELLVTSKTAGKRVDYHGQDGSLESFQLHGKKKAVTKPKKKLLKPLGPLLIKVYDRNAERAARGKPPPVPGHHVTRAEVVHLRFGPASKRRRGPLQPVKLGARKSCLSSASPNGRRGFSPFGFFGWSTAKPASGGSLRYPCFCAQTNIDFTSAM